MRPESQSRFIVHSLRDHLFLEHALLVSDVMGALEAACRKHAGVRLLTPDKNTLPNSGAERREPVQWTVNIGGRFKCGVIPDRVFGLEFAHKNGRQDRAWFFLEVDRATMPVTRGRLAKSSFYRKLLAYEATWTQNLHRTRFGWPRFRVLTVTTNAERVQHLLDARPRLECGRGLFCSLISGHSRITPTFSRCVGKRAAPVSSLACSIDWLFYQSPGGAQTLPHLGLSHGRLGSKGGAALLSCQPMEPNTSRPSRSDGGGPRSGQEVSEPAVASTPRS